MGEDKDGDGRVADDDDSETIEDVDRFRGLKTSKSRKRKARQRNVEQQHGGRESAGLPSMSEARRVRRIRSWARWMHGGEEEDLHIISRNIKSLYSS